MCSSTSLSYGNIDLYGLDDFEEITSFDSPFITPTKCLFKINVSDLVQNFGFKLQDENPIKATSNSCVFSASISFDMKTTSQLNDYFSSSISHNYALKISTNKSRVFKEFENYKNLPYSKKLVQSYDIFEINEFAILQMELCKGDIYGVLIDEKELWKLIHDISEALNVIHYSDLIHLDISPSNILVQDDEFKLADFGNIIENGTFSLGDEGSGPYLAPEVLMFPGNKESGYVHIWSAADIFSFGVVLLEAASGYFAPRGGSLMYDDLRKGNIKLGQGVYKCNCSTELITLVNEMLDPDPYLRPTAEKILKHPCVRQFAKS